MQTCLKTGRECLSLTVAHSMNENSIVVREDRSIDLSTEEQRMAEFAKLIEKSQRICTEAECGIVAYASALALESTTRRVLGNEISFRRKDEV